MNDTPWIVMTERPFGCWCKHCDGRLTIGALGDTHDLLAAIKEFVEDHAACQPVPAKERV